MASGGYAVSSRLLCAEEDASIFYGSVNGGDVADNIGNGTWQPMNPRIILQDISFHGVGDRFFSGFPMQSEGCLALLFEKEMEHLPACDYLKRLRTGDLDSGVRCQAIDWISKAVSEFNFGPLCSYLSVNYLDRFLSAYELPNRKAWMMQLLSVVCLSIAAKMEEIDVPLSLDLQTGESKFIFEGKTIQRMELLVLSTLKWRMQSVTPFSFIDYFLYKLNDYQMPPRSSLLESIQLIQSLIRGIDFLEFKPSELAAAVAISVTVEAQTVDPDKAISLLSGHVEKMRLHKCIELIHNLSLEGGLPKILSASGLSLPQSPKGVLDAGTCLSYRSEDITPTGSCANSTHTPTGSCANSTHNSPVPPAKRRKLDRCCEGVDP